MVREDQRGSVAQWVLCPASGQIWTVAPEPRPYGGKFHLWWPQQFRPCLHRYLSRMPRKHGMLGSLSQYAIQGIERRIRETAPDAGADAIHAWATGNSVIARPSVL